MATLKGININKYIANMDKITRNFKDIKDLIKKEIEENGGRISYNRVEEYEDLIFEIKKVAVINKAFLADSKLINLEGKELSIFCQKIGLDEDIFFKQQITLQRIESFNLDKFIKSIKKDVEIISVKEQNEQIENLEKLAYNDNLTGLYNRTKYEEVLDNTSFTEFGVIFFDLNDLKKTNDSLGHEHGDSLLLTFASILNGARTGFEDIFRIGGDEFIVIFKDCNKNKINLYLAMFEDKLEENNATNSVKVSTAFGIAHSKDEQPGLNPRELVRLADERMYDMKVGMKKARE